MRCSPSHLFRPVLAVGLVPLLATALVCVARNQLRPTANAQQVSRARTEIEHSTSSNSAPAQTLLSTPLAIFHDSVWGLYRWQIIAAAVLVIFQTLLIVALLLERNRKKSAAQLLADSEKRYRNVVETQTELICRYLPDTTITFVNDAYCRYFSKSRDELIGSKFLDLIPENAREAARNHVQSLIDNPRTEIDEHEVLLADGSIGWQQWIDHVISHQPIVELQGIGRDITERKRAEEALTNSEEFNRRIVESTSDCVKVLDLEGRLIYISERGQQMLEIPFIEPCINSLWVELWEGPGRLKAVDALTKARNGETGSFEGFNTISGAPHWWHTVITPMRGAHGNVERLLAVSRDITEQKLADKAARDSEERFAKAFRANPQPMSITTLANGMFVDVNQSFLAMSGFTREEVVGQTSIDLQVFESLEDRDRRVVEPLLESGIIRNFELEFRTKSGTVKTLLSAAELMELDGEQCILVASTDISDRKALEENLRLSEREFSTLVENSPDIIARLDQNLRIIYISPTLQKVVPHLNVEVMLGKTPSELALDGYDWESFERICKEAIARRKPTQRAFSYQDHHYWTRIIPEFSDNGDVESVMSISEDVTDHMRSEQELLQLTERLFNLQDEERRRIARELHDGTAQNLFAISVNLARLDQLSQAQDDARNLIAECQSLGDQSLQEIRTLSYLLHPPLLDQAGLVSALQWYVEGFTKRSGIYVDLYAQPIGRLPSDVEMALFRVVQEALTNVRRHSASETANIRLERKPDVVLLEIKDHGQGLSVAKNGHEPNGLISIGVGIPGMRQRLRQLGGTLEIVSNQKGTTISATVPLSNGVSHGKNPSR